MSSYKVITEYSFVDSCANVTKVLIGCTDSVRVKESNDPWVLLGDGSARVGKGRS